MLNPKPSPPKFVPLLGLVLLLLALACAVLLVKFKKSARVVSESELSFVESPVTERVERIQIGKNLPLTSKEPPVLFTLLRVKQKGKSLWKIPDLGNARADSQKVASFLTRLTEIMPVLRDPKKSIATPSGSASATYKFALFDGRWNSLLSLLAEAEKDKEGGIWVREEGSAHTYVIRQDLFSGIGIGQDPQRERPQIEYWLASNPVEIDWERVQSIELELSSGSKATTTHFSREGNSEQIHKLVASLNAWKAINVLTEIDPVKYGFDRPQTQIRLILDGGEAIRIRIGKRDLKQGAHFIEVSTEPVVFLVPGPVLEF